MIVLRRVVGHSMAELDEGKLVFAIKNTKTTLGDIVIAKYKGTEVIKHISDERGSKVYLSGKDKAHDIGWVENSNILAKVVWPKVK